MEGNRRENLQSQLSVVRVVGAEDRGKDRRVEGEVEGTDRGSVEAGSESLLLQLV